MGRTRAVSVAAHRSVHPIFKSLNTRIAPSMGKRPRLSRRHYVIALMVLALLVAYRLSIYAPSGAVLRSSDARSSDTRPVAPAAASALVAASRLSTSHHCSFEAQIEYTCKGCPILIRQTRKLSARTQEECCSHCWAWSGCGVASFSKDGSCVLKPPDFTRVHVRNRKKRFAKDITSCVVYDRIDPLRIILNISSAQHSVLNRPKIDVSINADIAWQNLLGYRAAQGPVSDTAVIEVGMHS